MNVVNQCSFTCIVSLHYKAKCFILKFKTQSSICTFAMALHVSTLCAVGILQGYLLEGNFLVLFIFMVGCEVQGRAYLGGFGWQLVVNSCWLIRDGFFNSSELGGCLIYFNPISVSFIGCANNSVIKNLGVVYAIEKSCLSKVKACLTQVYPKLKKQGFAWKLHNCKLMTWAFFKISNNQPIDLNVNQIMICIICNNHMCNLKILASCIECHKGFIAYYKANGIIAMKKHVKVTHKSFGFKTQYTCCA